MITVEEKNEKISGAAATIIFHTLLLLLFILLKLPANDVQAGIQDVNEGILIDFGNSYSGMGETENMQANQLIAQSSLQQVSSSDETNEVVQTQNMEDAPVFSAKNKAEQVIQPQPDQNLLNALSKIRNNSSQNSGDGTSTIPGNEGNPDGHESGLSEGNSPEGTWKLKSAGRKMIGRIEIINESQETGIVAVEIIVDKYGKITRATPVLMGSTTTNLYLWNKAKNGLEGKTLFNQSATGEEARGIIYINFTLR